MRHASASRGSALGVVRRIMVVAIMATLVLGTTGCGLVTAIDWAKVFENLTSNRKKKHRDEDKKVEPTDLGTAEYPKGSTSPVKIHEWDSRELEPDEYELTYILDPKAATKVESDYQDFARKVRFNDMGAGKFRWVPPPGCPKDMGCVFQALADESREQLLPLVELFRERKKRKKLDSLELAELVVTFVQNIEYQVPATEPFGVLAPALIVSQKHGDCDSKSLLAHVILKELGYDTIMMSSSAHAHSMLGIGIPVSGHKMHFDGRDYAFTEMTAKNSPIGHINSDLTRPDDWVVVPLKAPLASWQP